MLNMPLEEQERLVGRSKEESRKSFCRGYAMAREQKFGRPMEEYEIGIMMDRFQEYWERQVLHSAKKVLDKTLGPINEE